VNGGWIYLGDALSNRIYPKNKYRHLTGSSQIDNNWIPIFPDASQTETWLLWRFRELEAFLVACSKTHYS
jgi:hypothetical protein